MNIERIKHDLEQLATFSEPCKNGITRPSYSKSYRQAVEYLKKSMLDVGLTVREDALGNIYGTLTGTNSQKGTIISGSHIDTVRSGGAFDGIAGVVCAIEVARLLKDKGEQLKHNYEIIGLIGEEGTRFGRTLMGSQFIEGTFNNDHLEQFIDEEGRTLAEVLLEYNGKTDISSVNRRLENVKAFLELHIEQGPTLEKNGVDIGIVKNIMGVSWFSITAKGQAGHAGSLPMDMRKDAGISAFKLAIALNKYVVDNFSGKATLTIGKMHLSPGSVNVVPVECEFTVDIRSGDWEVMRDIISFMKSSIETISKQTNTTFDSKILIQKQPVRLDKEYGDLIEHSCKKYDFSYQAIDSGAGHDAMIFSNIWRTAMIFVPSKNGISHSPEEFTEYHHFAQGTKVLLETIRQIDNK